MVRTMRIHPTALALILLVGCGLDPDTKTEDLPLIGEDKEPVARTPVADEPDDLGPIVIKGSKRGVAPEPPPPPSPRTPDPNPPFVPRDTTDAPPPPSSPRAPQPVPP